MTAVTELWLRQRRNCSGASDGTTVVPAKERQQWKRRSHGGNNQGGGSSKGITAIAAKERWPWQQRSCGGTGKEAAATTMKESRQS